MGWFNHQLEVVGNPLFPNYHLFIFVDDFSGIDPNLEAKEIRKHGKEFWLSKYIFGDTPLKINSSNLKMDALEDDFHGFSFSRGSSG